MYIAKLLLSQALLETASVTWAVCTLSITQASP